MLHPEALEAYRRMTPSQRFKVMLAVPEQYATGWVDAVAGMPLIRARQWIADKAVDIGIFLAESRFQRSLIDRRQQLEVDDMRAWVEPGRSDRTEGRFGSASRYRRCVGHFAYARGTRRSLYAQMVRRTGRAAAA